MAKKFGWLTVVLLAFILIMGCANSDGESVSKDDEPKNQVQDATQKPTPTATPTVNQQPVTLKFGMPPVGWLTPEEFQKYIVDPAKKKYPHITIDKVDIETNVEALQKTVLQGVTLDLYIASSNAGIGQFREVNLTMDIEELAKKHQFDLNRLDPQSIQVVRNVSEGNTIAALPYISSFAALYYNKDIFDKFGEGYPGDGMTWDDAITVAKKVTRTSDGVNYLGLNGENVWRVAFQLDAGYVNPETNEVIVNSDKWKSVFQTYKNVFSIPGNEHLDGGKAIEAFEKDKRLAMFAAGNRLSLTEAAGLNWDIASYPSFPENPGKGLGYDLHVIGITNVSKNKDAAFDVVATLLSDEVQMELSKDGKVSTIQNRAIQDNFGVDLDYLKGKNVQAIYKTTPVIPTTRTKYDVQARAKVNQLFKQVAAGDLDINTALMQAEEQIKLLVESEK